MSRIKLFLTWEEGNLEAAMSEEEEKTALCHKTGTPSLTKQLLQIVLFDMLHLFPFSVTGQQETEHLALPLGVGRAHFQGHLTMNLTLFIIYSLVIDSLCYKLQRNGFRNMLPVQVRVVCQDEMCHTPCSKNIHISCDSSFSPLEKAEPQEKDRQSMTTGILGLFGFHAVFVHHVH